MMDRLQPDCSACADLCCLAYAFDAGHGFGVDKSPNVACPNLGAKGCGIHSELASCGYSGCVQYNCYGAGVRVTQDVFSGQDWRRDARLIGPMCGALRQLAPAHEQAALLVHALDLPVPDAVKADLRDLAGRLLSCEPVQAQALTQTARLKLRELQKHLPK